jgi:hypothetical protein
LREVFKYFTKLLTKTRGKKNERGTSAPMPPAALDVIFRAMKGLRVYQPAGFKGVPDARDENAEIAPEEATTATTRRDETISWDWNQKAADWVDASTGECLSGYEPEERFRALVGALSPP